MKKRRMMALMGAALTAAMLMTGCGKEETQAPAETTAAAETESVAETQAAETESTEVGTETAEEENPLAGKHFKVGI